VIFHAGAEHVFHLEKGLGDLVETSDVVLVVLDGVKGHGERQVGEVGVDAAASAGCAEGISYSFRSKSSTRCWSWRSKRSCEMRSCSGKPAASMALMRARSERSR